jgi:4-nitrophenyl phosphatase
VVPEEIITSAQATAEHLAGQAAPGTPIYVIGMAGLRQPLTEQGFHLLDDHAELGDARYVVVGWDRHLTYDKLAEAALHIRAGATFIGTNPDPTWPSERGQAPGTGATLAALQTATDVAPTVIGKPSSLMFQIAMKRMGADAAHTAMIGDRLTTDIAGAKNANLKTVLLLSGVTSAAELAESTLQPDLRFENLAALTQAWKAIPAA